MKADKVMGALGGGSAVFVLLMLCWYLRWDALAKDQIIAVKNTIERHEANWSKVGGRISIRYADIIANGFPFTLSIRVLQPQLRASINGQSVIIYSAYLKFVPEDRDSWQYRLEYLPDFTVRREDGRQGDYYIHLYQKPKMLVYAPPTLDAVANSKNEYGITFPEKFIVGVQRGKISHDAAFEVIPTSEPLWRYMPPDIHPPLTWLMGFLDEATKI